MMRKTLWLITTALLLGAMSGTAVYGMEFCYHGNMVPSVSNSAGTGMQFTPDAVSNGSVVYDALAIDKLAWHISDLVGAGEFWALDPHPGISHIDGATVLARVKVLSDTHAGPPGSPNIGIIDSNTGNHCRYHFSGAAGHISETRRGIEVTPASDNLWHELRMTVEGRYYGKDAPWSDNFNIYPDSALVGNDEWIGSAGASQIAVTTGYVTLTHTPGLGYNNAQQLVLAGDDGNLNFSCKIKAGTTPGVGGGFFWRLYLRDPDGAELASWYGTHDSVTPRITGVGAGPAQTLSGGWDTFRIHLDTTNQEANFWYTPEGGVEVLLNTFAFYQTPDSVLGIVDLDAWDRIGEMDPGFTILFDDFSVTGGVVAGNRRVINLYLDENPTPVLAISPAEPASGSRETFVFGSDSGMQDIYFDWVSGTNEGAFAPGEEVAVLGHSLIPSSPPPAITTILAAKTAADGEFVAIENALVASVFVDDAATNLSFSIQHMDRPHGIRVLTSEDEGAVFPGDTVGTIYGVTETTVGGERVIRAGLITGVVAGEPAAVPDPLALTNKASGGGAFGAQPAVVDNAFGPTFTWSSEAFNYPDSALVGNDGWYGTALAADMAVESNYLRVNGDHASVDATVDIDPVVAGIPIAVRCKIQKVGIGGSNFWSLWIDDPAGNNLARWYGTESGARPRIGGTNWVLDPVALTGGGVWDELEVKIYVATDTSEFWFNGGLLGTLDHSVVGAGDLVGRVRFLNQTSDIPGHTILFDDVEFDNVQAIDYTTVPAVGLNNIGLLTTITGKVTSTYDTGIYTDDFFYVDDGSGLKDGTYHPGLATLNVGVRCRHPYDPVGMMQMPIPDPEMLETDVTVTGVMGVENGARFFWVQSWENVTPP